MPIKKFFPFFANLFLIWSSILIYFFYPFYVDFLRFETLITLLILAFSYTFFGFIYYLRVSGDKLIVSKGSLVFSFFRKVGLKLFSPSSPSSFSFSSFERTALLFVLVKFFFLPLMINFVFANFFFVSSHISVIVDFFSNFSFSFFSVHFFPFIIGVFFLIDTLIFAFGYTFESSFLGNRVRSVEPSFLGWFVALICYPPFNSFLTSVIGWFPDTYITLSNPFLNVVLKFSVIFLLGIYVWATVALGFKSSNLTNRGIISHGPYRFIRHPAYISKNLAWWVVLLPVISWVAVFSMGVWSFIYHLRSVTEERHLIRDPDYVSYCKKVKYRYIPGFY